MPLIRGLDEQVGAQQLFDQPLAVGVACYGIAQGRAETVENAGLQQELADILALSGEDVFGQVLRQFLVAAGEGANHIARGCASTQRQRGQEQTGDPALGAVLEPGDFAVVDQQLAMLPNEGHGFRVAEAQGLGVDIQHLPLNAHAPQPEVRVDPRGDDQPPMRGQGGQQLLDEGERRGCIEGFEIVQDDGEVPLQPGQTLQQCLAIACGAFLCRQPIHHLESGLQVGDQPFRVVVRPV
ncbi:hypothetical protein D9M68_647240 [compost metagenome]